MLKVISHKNPDLDAISSTIVHAWYLENILNLEAKAYLSDKVRDEDKAILESFEVEIPEVLEKIKSEDNIVIVDTNNPDELPEGALKANIAEVIDHHELHGMKTDKAITVTIRPVGSTSTMIYDAVVPELEEIPEFIIKLLLAGILSETKNLTSDKTTDIDKDIVAEIAEMTELDIDEFYKEITS